MGDSGCTAPPDGDPWRWTLAQARSALAAGAMSPLEYRVALARRADDVAGLGSLLARASVTDASGSGPLAGIPVVLKDCIDTAELPTTAGTGALADRRPGQDAPVVTRLRAAGATVSAKSALHELSFGVTSAGAAAPPPRNPHRLDVICGGSSGGTAAAVAAGIAPVGLGADTGGSVRMPAALCGVVGFRPSVGRYDNAGTVPIAPTRDTIGPIARSVADVRTVDAVLARRRRPAGVVRLEGLRLGVPRGYWTDLDPEVADVARRTLDVLDAAGVTLVDVDLAAVVAMADEAAGPISMSEFCPAVVGYARDRGYGLDAEDIRAGIACAGVRRAWDESVAGVDPESYRRALELRRQARAAYAELLSGSSVAALVAPTTPLTARPIDELGDGSKTVMLNARPVSAFDTYIRHTATAGVLGLPGISLPAGTTPAGLPVGVELATAAGRDDDLLAVAAAVEPLLPECTVPTPDLATAPR